MHRDIERMVEIHMPVWVYVSSEHEKHTSLPSKPKELLEAVIDHSECIQADCCFICLTQLVQ